MSDLTLPPRTGSATAVRDSLTMIGRSIRMSRRQLDALLMALMLPIMMMLMFVYLFGGAIHTGTKYVTYVVPGILLLCVAYGSATTAVSVCQDMTGGIIDRFRSMDIGGTAVLSGHVVASIVRNAASTVLVFGVAFAVGFRPQASPLQWLGAAAILLLFMLAISWLAAAVGLAAKSAEAANGFTFFVIFLPYPSSALVPVATMPGWIHGFANNQPVTPVTETIRDLLLDRPVGSHAWSAVIWCGGIILGSVALSTFLFRRRTV